MLSRHVFLRRYCTAKPLSMLICCTVVALVVLHESLTVSESTQRTQETFHPIPRSLQKPPDDVLTVKKLPVKENLTKRVVLSYQTVSQQYLADSEKIPKIVHITWRDTQLPSWPREWLPKWRKTNPDWQVWFWSDKAADQFITTKFPKYSEMYKQYGSNIQRADVMRYFILYEFGGLYADLDVEPLKSLTQFRDDHACVLSSEPEEHARFVYKEQEVMALTGYRVACNAVMACRRRHPFFKYVIDMLPMVRNIKEPLLSTGPMMLTYRYLAYEYFVRNIIGPSPHRVLQKRSEVLVAPGPWFMPSYDEMQSGRLKQLCLAGNLDPAQKTLCARLLAPNFVNGPQASSLANHHWIHSWIKGTSHSNDPSSVDIVELIPDVVFPNEVLKFEEV